MVFMDYYVVGWLVMLNMMMVMMIMLGAHSQDGGHQVERWSYVIIIIIY